MPSLCILLDDCHFSMYGSPPFSGCGTQGMAKVRIFGSPIHGAEFWFLPVWPLINKYFPQRTQKSWSCLTHFLAVDVFKIVCHWLALLDFSTPHAIWHCANVQGAYFIAAWRPVRLATCHVQIEWKTRLAQQMQALGKAFELTAEVRRLRTEFMAPLDEQFQEAIQALQVFTGVQPHFTQ